MALRLTTYRHSAALPADLPGESTFHSVAAFRLFESTPGYAPLLVVATEGPVVVARLLGVTSNRMRHLPMPFRRCVVWGLGEHLSAEHDRDRVFALMLDRLTAEALRDAAIVEFRHLEQPLLGYKAFRASGYFAVRWLRVRNSLHSVPQAEDRFTATRLREVQTGLKSGATVAEATSEAEVDAFVHMLRRAYRGRARRFFPTSDLFARMRRVLTERGLMRIFVVRLGEQVIGGSVCLYSGTNAYLWFSGGLYRRYARLYPVVLADYAAMADAKRRGYRHFEFIDVGLPYMHHGYREFALRFGGQQLSTRRWYRLRLGWLNRLLCWMHE